MHLLFSSGGSRRRMVMVAIVAALFATSCSATPSVTTVGATVSTASAAEIGAPTIGIADAPTEPESVAVGPSALEPALAEQELAAPESSEAQPSTQAVPTSPSPPSDDAEVPENPTGTNPALDVVRGLLRSPLDEGQLAAHEELCRSEGKPIRWVGNSNLVTKVTVAGHPWAGSLADAAAEKADDYDYSEDHWLNLCVTLVSEPTELRPCADDTDSGGRGPIVLEGVRAIAFLDDPAGSRLLTSSMVLFGSCPYEREGVELADLLSRIEAGNGQLPSELSPILFDSFIGDLLDFAGAMHQVPAFNDAQCRALAAALVARADFVVAANETFGMDTFGNLGPVARVPSTPEVRARGGARESAGRVGVRAQQHFFVPRTWVFRAFDVDDDAAISYGSVYSNTRWGGYTPHGAVAHLAESLWDPTRTDPGEMLRRGLELLEAGCTATQISAADVTGAPGMEPFDVATSDPSITCGWLQASYGYRLEHRRALANADFEAADDLNTILYSLQDRSQDIFRIESFLGETGIYAMLAVERSIASLTDPSQEAAPNLEEFAPGYQESQDRMDTFARTRCNAIPDFLFDVPTIAEVLDGGSPSPDDLPLFPESEGYRTRCEVWNDFYDARASLWAQLPEAASTSAPSSALVTARRSLDKEWLAKQSVMAMRPGFAQLIDDWNVMTEANHALWLAATTGQSPRIDADQLKAAEAAVLAAVLHSCQAEERFDPDIAAALLPPLAES